MWECDWTQTSEFKRIISSLKKDYTFISLADAYNHILHDTIRTKKYAVLTADDGWSSQANIIPWLSKEKIPITLFLNPLYMDGIHKQSRDTEKLLTVEEINVIVSTYAPYVTIGSHGWSHKDCCKMSTDEFDDNYKKAESALKIMAGYIPFYAFTFGSHTKEQIQYLRDKKVVPVLLNGGMNYHGDIVDRQCIDLGMRY